MFGCFGRMAELIQISVCGLQFCLCLYECAVCDGEGFGLVFGFFVGEGGGFSQLRDCTFCVYCALIEVVAAQACRCKFRFGYSKCLLGNRALKVFVLELVAHGVALGVQIGNGFEP